MKSCPLAVKRGFYHTSQYNPDTEEQKSDMKFSSDSNLTLHGGKIWHQVGNICSLFWNSYLNWKTLHIGR